MYALVLTLGLLTGVSSVHFEQSANARQRAAALATVADEHAAAGRLAEAIRVMEEAERIAPVWPELKVNLAALRSQAGDYAGAIAAARGALQIDNGLEGAWLNLGLAQLKSGDATAAAATLTRFKDRRDAPPVAIAALGLALLRIGRTAEAAATLQRAVDAGMRDADVLLSLGDAEDAKHDWTAAEAAYRRALTANPAVPRGHYSLGLVLYKQQRYDEAAGEFDRELASDPVYPPALRYRAELELDRGNADAAVPFLQRLTATAPRDVDGWRLLGRARLDLAGATDVAEAAVALQRAIELAPEDSSAHFLLGRALARAGRKVEADAAFARASELNQRLRDRLQQRVSGKKGGGASPNR